MAQVRRPKLGENVVAVMRRIGHRHAVLVPAHSVVVIDMGKVDEKVAEAAKRLAMLEQERKRTQALLEDLVQQRKAFDAMTIDRDGDDPEVAQPPEPKPEAAPKSEPAPGPEATRVP